MLARKSLGVKGNHGVMLAWESLGPIGVKGSPRVVFATDRTRNQEPQRLLFGEHRDDEDSDRGVVQPRFRTCGWGYGFDCRGSPGKPKSAGHRHCCLKSNGAFEPAGF